eukprot:scaffold34115_cov46-Attheya_sp.AAC.2
MFMPILAKALEDVEDVQLQAHHIVISMCAHHPLSVISAVESFVEPLEKTLNKKKAQKTGTELDCRKLAEFMERTKNNVKYQSMLESIAEERYLELTDGIHIIYWRFMAGFIQAGVTRFKQTGISVLPFSNKATMVSTFCLLTLVVVPPSTPFVF